MNTLLICSFAFTSLLQLGQNKESGLQIELDGGKTIVPKCADLGQAEKIKVPGDPKAPRLVDRSDKVVTKYKLDQDQAYGLHYTISSYTKESKPGLRYTRMILSMTNTTKEPIKIGKLSLLRNQLTDASFEINGKTDGAVAVQKNGSGFDFMAIEHPMAKMTLSNEQFPKWNPQIFSKKIWDFPVLAAGGDLTLTFRYTSGALRADIGKVEILGTSIKDEHHGYSGIIQSDNIYELKNVPAGKNTVRVTFTYERNPKDDNTWGFVELKGIQQTEPKRATVSLPIVDALRPGQTWEYSLVIGHADDPSQFRRTFQRYLQMERAYPYRAYPHYNSWYDLCIGRNDARRWQERMNEAECIDTIRSVSKELAKRGEKFNSYLWDDGWDDWDSFWDFHPGFPNGFEKIAKEAKAVGSSISAWMSPCGGYGGSSDHRIAHARKAGILKKGDSLLRLSQPSYYKMFRDRCISMIKDYGMDIFKFDRMGDGQDSNGSSPQTAADVRAVFALIEELRAAKPDVFVNATVGTWASPYWLRWTDSIWRGGFDWWMAGPGSKREQWITYRDNITYDRFIRSNSLFPVNGLMLHGVTISREGMPGVASTAKTEESTRSIKNEIWMMAGSGIALQEYYISDHLFIPEWWDTIASAIHWCRANVETLRDSHWVGGDPLKQNIPQVYGYASLGSDKGIIMLRNPSDKPATYALCPDEALEMPSKLCGRKVNGMKTIYRSYPTAVPAYAKTSDSKNIVLKPFEVVLVEMTF